MQFTAYFTIIGIVVIVIIDIAYTLMPKEIDSQAYSTIEYIQKLLMVVLVGNYYPKGILHFFEKIKLALFTPNIFSLNKSVARWMHYSQTDQRLGTLGLPSNSGIANF